MQDLNVLYQVCVFLPIGKPRWPLWLIFSETFLTSPLKPLNGIQQNLTVGKFLISSSKFQADQKKQDGCPSFWLAKTCFTSPLKLLNAIQGNLTGSNISMSSTKFVFFRLIRKPRWLPLSVIGSYIFYFSETTEQNSTKLHEKQECKLCPLKILCF